MADEYDDVERLKAWWKEYGKQVVVGALIGIGGIGGVLAWNQHNASQQQQASSAYVQLVAQVEAEQHQQTIADSERLIEQFKGSGYALLAALFAAQSAVALEHFDAAIERLNWVISNAPYPEIATMASVRIARIQRHQKRLDAALDTLDSITGNLMTGLRAELRGDIYTDLGDHSEALVAYEDALQADDGTSDFYQRTQIKQDSLQPTAPQIAVPTADTTGVAGG